MQIQGRLPPQAVAILKKAAETPAVKPEKLARVAAVNKAEAEVKLLFPYFFKKGL